MAETLSLVQQNANGIALLLGVTLLWFVMFVNRKQSNCLDLITIDGRYNVEKIGQCFGILVAVTAPIYPTIHGLPADSTVLGVSLAYLGCIRGYAKYLQSKAEKKP